MKEIIERHTKIIEDMLDLQAKMLEIMRLMTSPTIIESSKPLDLRDLDLAMGKVEAVDD